MILDSISNCERYYALNPRLKAAFDYLGQTDVQALTPGRHDIDGDDLFVTVSELDLKPVEEALFEVHDEYIDIQVVFGGAELFGWTAACRRANLISHATCGSLPILPKRSMPCARVSSRYSFRRMRTRRCSAAVMCASLYSR